GCGRSHCPGGSRRQVSRRWRGGRFGRHGKSTRRLRLGRSPAEVFSCRCSGCSWANPSSISTVRIAVLTPARRAGLGFTTARAVLLRETGRGRPARGTPCRGHTLV